MPPARSPRFRWVILGVVWTSCLMIYLTRLTIGPLSPFLKDALGLSNAQIGSLVSATIIVYAPTMIVAGWLVDRIGVHRMVTAGSLIIALSLMVIFFAPSYSVMLAALAVSGLGAGCIFPSAVKALVLWFSRRERATVLGLNQTAVNIGGIIGAIVLPSVAIALGWRYGFLLVALTGFAICLATALVYRNPPSEAPLVGEVTSGSGAAPVPASHPPRKLFGSRDIWMLGLAGLFLCIVEYAGMTHIVLYLKEKLGFSAVAAGGMLAMAEAAGALGKPVSGLASDRLFGGRRRPVFLLMAVGSGLVSLALAAMGESPGWLLYPVLAVLGLMTIGWGGLYAAIAGELGGRERAGVAAGVSASIVITGGMIGPPLFGFIVDETGSYSMAWLAMAFFAALAVIALALIREHTSTT